MGTDPEAVARTLPDHESRRGVEQLRDRHPRREEAIARLHEVLRRVARHELIRRVAS